MGRKIVVSGICQAPGISEALKLMLPLDDISFLSPPDAGKDEATTSFIEQIRKAEVWVTGIADGTEDLPVQSHNPNLEVVRWPQITFPAFHPDIAFASSGRHHITSMGCIYNSALCLWAWKNRIDPDRAAGLFCADVFKALGYLDAWNPSVASMRRRFSECALDFDQFFLPVKRQGVFMHSNLHAKLSPILHLARQIAIKLGADRRILHEPLEDFMADPLIFDAVWPVYPEIGDVLGVPSCYRWKYRQVYCHDLQSYIRTSYDSYDSQPIDPENICCDRFAGDIFDRILLNS